MRTAPTRRGRTASLSAAALATFALVATAVPAGAATTPSDQAADAAAGWSARQLVDGNHMAVDFGGTLYDDVGLTLDAVYAFAAAKESYAAGGRAMTWLAQPEKLSGYIGDGATESYSGATAKVALAVQVRKGNPTAFGGRNLIAELRALQGPDGRFRDKSAFGDYSNAFGQSLAVLALSRTNTKPVKAAAFLGGTKCADGGYPLYPGTTPCQSDVDSTAMAVQALLAAGRTGDAARGVSYLVSQQRADGAFLAYGTANSNSTGLAAQALSDAGKSAAAAKARSFLLKLQSGCDAPAAQRGAIAYDETGYNGSTVTRATVQAVLGLSGTGFRNLTAAGSRAGDPVLTCK